MSNLAIICAVRRTVQAHRFSADGCIRFHRAHFLDALVDHLPAGAAHFGKRLTAYTYSPVAHQSEPQIRLQFSDGSAAICDLLVGCDGIKSVVRKQLLEDHVHKGGGDPQLQSYIEPVWSGTIAYRGLIPVKRVRNADGTEHRAIRSPMMVRASPEDGRHRLQ